MRITTFVLAAAAATAALPAAAATPIVTYAHATGTVASGTSIFQNFDGFTAGQALPGTNAYVYNATNSVAMLPAFGSYGNFAAVLAGGSYSVTFAPTAIFSFVLGSLDTYNAITLALADGTTQTYTGGQIVRGLSFSATDSSTNGSNGVVTFNAGGSTGGPLITGATFSSAGNTFEFDNLAIAGVPEPATWALMVAGFGAAGFAMRRRRDRARAIA